MSQLGLPSSIQWVGGFGKDLGDGGSLNLAPANGDPPAALVGVVLLVLAGIGIGELLLKDTSISSPLEFCSRNGLVLDLGSLAD